MRNSRVLTLKQSVHFFARFIFWVPIAICSGLLIYNTIPYFSFSRNFTFIQERAFLFESKFYTTAFYTHIAAGAFCIATALLQFSSAILKKRRKLHIWSGRIYVAVVLLIGAPTGLYMSFFAKGSLFERLLFMFMALFWFFSTYKGLVSILAKNVLAHKHWMIRSYAMALTAVSFRIYHLLFYFLEWDHLDNYEISLWISVIGNMLVAEYLIYRKSRPYLKVVFNSK